MNLEELIGEERAGRGAVALRGHTDLEQTAVHAGVETGEVYYHFLSEGEFQIQVVLVD